MIPEGEGSPPINDDIMLAGYRECATEALNWLLGLGYEPGHPLIRSLVAHLTKKQAYLEKLNLERFLIDKTSENSDTIRLEDCPESHSTIEVSLQIRNNKEIQKLLVDAAFKGCDLRYSAGLP